MFVRHRARQGRHRWLALLAREEYRYSPYRYMVPNVLKGDGLADAERGPEGGPA